MTPLSTLTPEALHALVARSLEGVTEGPWTFGPLNRNYMAWLRNETHIIGQLTQGIDKEAQANKDFIAQSRDLVPELDRRLRETEAKLEELTIAHEEIVTLWLSGEGAGDGTNALAGKMRRLSEVALDRIAAITQP